MGSISQNGTPESYDYIVVGAGIGGTVVSSRLKERHPDYSVLLIEAGHDASRDPMVQQPLMAPLLQGGEFDWNYASVPQEGLDGRVVVENAGKALGGGSAINYGRMC